MKEGCFFFLGGKNLAFVSKGPFFGGGAALTGAWPTQEGRRFRDSTIAGSLGAPESWVNVLGGRVHLLLRSETNLSRYVTW